MGSEEKKKKIKILQISNISVSASRDHVFSMCQYIGRIDDIRMYPSDANLTSTTTQKVAFVKFDDDRCVEVGQHLTNTVLIDQSIVCVPWLHDTIPDETTFMNSGGVAMAGVRQLPPHVSNKVATDADGHAILLTVDPTLEQLGLPAYPQLPGDTDPAKVEEIRRTIYVGNLPKGVDGQAVADYFSMFGEVMYVRMAQVPPALPCAYAYVEYAQQTSVPVALQNNGTDYEGRALKIQHSRVAIIKPQQKTADQALEEVEEAIRMGKGGDRRSRTPRRRRSPSPRRRSRSKERRRSRSRSRRSRSRKRSRSKDRRRSRDRKRSRSKDRRRRSRSRDKRDRSRDRKKTRSRSRDRKKDRKDRKRSRSRSKERESDRKRDRREKSVEKKKVKEEIKEEVMEETNGKTPEKRKDEDDLLREQVMQTMSTTKLESNQSGDETDKTPSKVRNERKPLDSDSD